MFVRKKSNSAPCFKCSKNRQPRYGIWAFRAPANAAPPPKGKDLAEDGLEMIFQGISMPALMMAGGICGVDGTEGLAEPLAGGLAKVVVKTGSKLGKFKKTETVRKKVFKPRTIKAPRFQTGGMIYRLFDGRMKWMCDGPAYKGHDHVINRRRKKRSKLGKYLDGICGFKHRKRVLRYVCGDCFRKLTGENPTPGGFDRRLKDPRIERIKKEFASRYQTGTRFPGH